MRRGRVLVVDRIAGGMTHPRAFFWLRRRLDQTCIAGVPTRSDPASQPGAAHPARGRVLMVDDDPDFQGAVRSVLETRGCSVAEAANSPDALASAHAERFAAILLDCRMPGMTGQEVYAALRSSGDSIPVVLVTAKLEVRDIATQLGVAQYLAKPFGFDELITVVERATSPVQGDFGH